MLCPPVATLRDVIVQLADPKRFARLLLAAAGILSPTGPLWAQADTTTACDGRSVQVVDVEPGRPSFHGALGLWRKAARALGLHHQTTAAGLVRRFVSLDPGMNCTEFRRSESERILRAQPFLADATVTTIRTGDSIRVNVTTVDEVPVIVGARVRGSSIQAFNLGSLNLLGAGLHVEGRWEEGRTYRDGFGGKVAHQQLFGRPYSLVVDGQRHPIGEYFTGSVMHPFYTDLQRIAWHAGYSISKDVARLRRPDRTELLQPLDRWMWNVGGVLRFGPPHKLGLIGGMVLGERAVPRHEFALVDSLTGGSQPTSDTAGVRRYSPYDVTNVAGILGIRALTYTRRRGLDALAAEQDVATGAQVGATFGFAPSAEVPLRESFGFLDAYVGQSWRRHFVAMRTEVESRLDLTRREARHVIASGRAAWYMQPRTHWVSELSVEAAGGWKTILPFQLDLGDTRSGVRGYARSLEPGAQRVVARLEQRVDLARIRDTRAAVGAAGFIDAGRTWAGDVPFGVATPIRASAGAAILAAVPARSRRTLRAEVAIPFTTGQGARPELRFTVREPTRGFWLEPARLTWARLSGVPERVFQWP
jgi:hypothetical protein